MSTIDCRFSINLDVYKGRMLDVEEIMATKATKRAVKNDDDNHADEETTRLSPSPTVDHIVDEEVVNAEDAAEE